MGYSIKLILPLLTPFRSSAANWKRLRNVWVLTYLSCKRSAIFSYCLETNLNGPIMELQICNSRKTFAAAAAGATATAAGMPTVAR